MRKIFLFILALLSIHFTAAAPVDSLLLQHMDSIERFLNMYPQERVYVMMDNNCYFKGEKLWWRANVVREDSLTPSPLSKILYVELVNNVGYPVETQKVKLIDGMASGCFNLRDTLNSGFYELRAYTAWMLNFCPGTHHGWSVLSESNIKTTLGPYYQQYLNGNAGIFSRVFPIYEKVNNGNFGQKRITRPPKMTSDLVSEDAEKLTIDFYPESGNLVEGVPAKIAFEAHTRSGQLVNVTGELWKGRRLIGHFSSFYGGKGYFAYTPDSTDDSDDLTQGLTLKVKYQGKKYSFSLPRTQKRGVTMAINQQPDAIECRVQRNSRTPGQNFGLMVTCRGSIYVKQIVDLSSPVQLLSVQKSSLPTGVNIFTLINQKGRIVAQREVFVINSDFTHNRISTDSIPVVSPYQKVNVRLQAPQGGCTPLAVSVTDEASADQSYNGDNVLSYLLLSSEIKGFIPDASYYFQSNDKAHRAALDALMLVQGWTRYNFEEMQNPSAWQPRFTVERQLNFRARLWDTRDEPLNASAWKVPRRPVWVYMELPLDSARGIRGETLTGKDGMFEFTLPDFKGSSYSSIYLNRYSSKAIGERAAGELGHVHSAYNLRDSLIYAYYAITPLNAFAPLAKPYNFYETHWPDNDGTGELANTFAGTTDNDYTLTYDALTHAYTLPDVTKKARRKWVNFDPSKPTLSVPVNDLFTWISYTTGQINQFGVNPTLYSGILSRGLMNLGLNGRAEIYIDHHILRDGYLPGLGSYYAMPTTDNTGSLPKGNHWFPAAENFQVCNIFADMNNRDLIYQRYRRATGIIFSYIGYKNNYVTTVKIDYLTDTIVPLGNMMPYVERDRINVYGYTPECEFYHPDYSHTPLPKQVDYRRTVYWNPHVETSADGKATISFYNNGFSRRLRIKVEGITPRGMPVSN